MFVVSKILSDFFPRKNPGINLFPSMTSRRIQVVFSTMSGGNNQQLEVHSELTFLPKSCFNGKLHSSKSSKLKWQPKMGLVKMYLLLNMGDFNCHVSSPEGTQIETTKKSLGDKPPFSTKKTMIFREEESPMISKKCLWWGNSHNFHMIGEGHKPK